MKRSTLSHAFWAIILLLTFSVVSRGNTAVAANSTIEKTTLVDTYVTSGNPQSSYVENKRLSVGYDSATGDKIERSLLKFALSTTEIPAGSVIDSATLSLYLAATTPSDAAMSISVSQTSDWAEDINWEDHLALTINPNHAATTMVGTQGQWYEWDLQPLLQAWINSADRGANLSLIMQSNLTSGQHERLFWSNNCAPSECEPVPGLRPQLAVNYTAPTPVPVATSTPTVTPTPTATVQPTAPPTPTPTATPTPAVLLWLKNDPVEADIAVGEIITYSIGYANNGSADVENVRLIGFVPNQTAYVDSDTNGGCVGTVVAWHLGTLEQTARGQVSYQVERVSATAPSCGAATALNAATASTAELLFLLENASNAHSLRHAAQGNDTSAIVNGGAVVFWDYNGAYNQSQTSNGVRNPQSMIYLPMVFAGGSD